MCGLPVLLFLPSPWDGARVLLGEACLRDADGGVSILEPSSCSSLRDWCVPNGFANEVCPPSLAA